MSRQSTMTNFFKSHKMSVPSSPCSSNTLRSNSEQTRKRSSEHPSFGTPTKSPKKCLEDKDKNDGATSTNEIGSSAGASRTSENSVIVCCTSLSQKSSDFKTTNNLELENHERRLDDNTGVIDLCSDDEDRPSKCTSLGQVQVNLHADKTSRGAISSEPIVALPTQSPSNVSLAEGAPTNKILTNEHQVPVDDDVFLVLKDDEEVIDLCDDEENVPNNEAPGKNNACGKNNGVDVDNINSGSIPLDSKDDTVHKEDNPITSQSSTSSSMPFDSGMYVECCYDFNSDDDIPMPTTPPTSVVPSTSSKLNEHQSSDTPNDEGLDSDSSQTTVIYSVQTPQTPKSTPRTPVSTFKSPNSAQKYFSPSKKRLVTSRRNVKRNLAKNLEESKDDPIFRKASIGLDDKTIFLLSIINKCIKNPSLLRLMDEASQNILRKCMLVEAPGMRLVCRLYWHKEGWKNIDKVKKILSSKNDGKIDDLTFSKAIKSLLENDLLISTGPNGNMLNFEDYTDILTGIQLKQICKELKLKIGSKQDAISALKDYINIKTIASYFHSPAPNKNNALRVLKIMSAKAGAHYKLSDLARKTIHDLYILMYLGIDYNLIRDKKLEFVLLNDKIGLETYPVSENLLDSASVVFKDREDFERYLSAHNEYENYLILEDNGKKCATVTRVYEEYKNIPESELSRCKSLPVWLRRFTPMYFLVKILESGIAELKKAKQAPFALEVLDAVMSQELCRQHKRAHWYAERALLLNQLGRPEEAAEVLLEGFQSDMSDEAKDEMRPRAKIIAKKKGLNLDEDKLSELRNYADKDDILEKNLPSRSIHQQPMERENTRGKLKFRTMKDGEMIVQDVEEFCLSQYIDSGEFTHGVHSEGRLVTAMFFLLFRDIIYWRPPGCAGVFLTRFQLFPLDMLSGSFYENRKERIDARLAQIERCSGDELADMLQAKWDEGPESGVQPGGQGAPAELLPLARALAGAAAQLLRRLARDPATRTGFPDLTLWNTSTRQVKFVEVKSDTDRPSMRQLQWMHYLQRHGIPTEFCYVGVNTTRNKARST